MTKRNPKSLVSDAAAKTNEIAIARATGKAAEWRSKYKKTVAAALDTERQLETLICISDTEACCAKKKFKRLQSSKPVGVAAVVPATDWHVEENVESAAVNGKNYFNIFEAESRIRRFYSKIIELIEWQNHLSPVVELWHPLLGDLLSGYIHEELMESNSLSPTEACVFLHEMLCFGIDLLLKETKLPIFIPTCVGNHGRTTPKKRIKTSCRNSFEWLLYMTLAKRYENHKRVAWHVGRGYHNTQEIRGRKVRFHHGDGLRYMGGVGGISIPVNKSIAQWDKVEPADFDIFGHWHTFLAHYPKWVSCGSLMGYSEYSVEIKAEFQHPTQTFIIIDRRYGMVQVTPIFLTKPNRS